MRLLFPRACLRISGHTDPQEGNCTHQSPQGLLLSPLPSTLDSGSLSYCILKCIPKVFYTFFQKVEPNDPHSECVPNAVTYCNKLHMVI